MDVLFSLKLGDKMQIRRYTLLLGCLLVTAATARPSIFGTVRGIVHDPDHRPISNAAVTLLAAASDYRQSTETSGTGEFEFRAVPVGDYRLHVVSPSFAPADRLLEVVSDSAPVLHIQMRLAEQRQSVEVSESAEVVNPQSSTPATVVTRGDIRITPGADLTNSMAMITDYVPGAYMTHDQLHIRGGHQVSWAIDGIPIPNTNIASNVGPQVDPKDIDYLEVQRGGYSSEYGDRTYGVFNVVPRTGFEFNREIEVNSTFGSFHQTNNQLSSATTRRDSPTSAASMGIAATTAWKRPVRKCCTTASGAWAGSARCSSI